MGAELTPRQQRIEDAGAWLATAGGTATPGELGAALGLNRARQADVLTDLAAARLVVRGHGRVQLTPAGLARFGGMEPGSAGRVLDEVLDPWPAGHRAFVELAVCGVIARHHLRAERPSPHAGFMAVGGTGAGKSAAGVLVCRLFGLDPIASTRHMPTMTENPLGRLAQIKGGAYQFLPSMLAGQPFALLDELDKADAAVQKATWPAFDGNTTLFIEDAAQDVAPTPMVTANPPTRGTDRLQNLPAHARRRSVVFDVGSASDYTRQDVRRFGAVYEWQPEPTQRLVLEALRPPATHSEVIREWIDELAQHFLTDRGREEFPGPAALELLTLARLALVDGEVSEEVAATHTMAAYLTVTETIPGQVDPDSGWSQVLGDWCRDQDGAPGVESLTAAISRGSAARAAAGAKAAGGRRHKARGDDAIREQGAALAERLRLAFEALDGRKLAHASTEQKAAAKGLQRLLRDYQGRAGKVSTATGLAEVTELSADPIARARELRAQIDQAGAHLEQAAKDGKDQARRGRADARQRNASAIQRRSQYRANQRDGLRQVRAEAKVLEPLWRRTKAKPGEIPSQVLSQLRINGTPLLTHHQAPAPAPRAGWRGFIPQTRQGWWAIAGTSTTLPTNALTAWGPNTRAVLAPMLAHLHRLEDDLARELGSKPRQHPNVPSAQTRAIAGR